MIAWYTADASSGLADLTEDGNAGEADDDEFESAAFDCLQACLRQSSRTADGAVRPSVSESSIGRR
jgi:hypothetical protein